MACVFDQTTSCPTIHQLGKDLAPLVATEDEESVQSTAFASDASDSDCSEDESDCGSASPFSFEDTMLIFDWDNTILPTTWLEERGLRLDGRGPSPTEEQRAQLRAMAEHARNTLRIAKTHGKVVLVTNAERGWVELSCEKFLPELYPSLQGVKILSARSTYERLGVAQPSEWKYLAFESEIDGFYERRSGDRQKNIISIGDSPHERWALIRVAERLPNSCAKALKFMEKPELGQLVREHQLIGGCLGDIVRYSGSLDLCIQRP